MNSLVRAAGTNVARRDPLPAGGPARESVKPAVAARRYLSIDILRAVAIILMIQVHFSEYLSEHRATPAGLYDLSGALGLIPAPLFTFLSGLSFSLWLGTQRRSGRSEADIVKYGFRRGAFVFVLGFAVNILIWLPGETFIWDILTLLGASSIVLTFVRNWRPGVLIGLCAVIVLVSPPLRDLSNYTTYWTAGSFKYAFTLKDVSLGFLLNGYFPLLPWLVFPLAGHAIGQLFFPRDDEEEGALPLVVPLLGILLISFALIGVVLEPHVAGWLSNYYANEWPDDFYPATTVYILATLGGTLVCLWALNWAIDLNERVTGSGVILSFFRRYSYFALTAYVVHLAVHIWPLWILATLEQQTSTQFYVGNAMNTAMALAAAGIFVVVFYVFTIFLERHRKYSLESFMRWCCD